LAGARIARYAPVSIPAHGMALNVTVQSYNGALEFGLTGCRRALPDIGDLADYMVEEARLLGRRVAEQSPAAAPAPAATAASADGAAARGTRRKPQLKVLAAPAPQPAPETAAPRRRRAAAA